jgi:hypothetical protein
LDDKTRTGNQNLVVAGHRILSSPSLTSNWAAMWTALASQQEQKPKYEHKREHEYEHEREYVYERKYEHERE